VVTDKPLLEHSPSVTLIVVEGSDIVLVRQSRPGAPRPTLELPQETFEPGETAIDAAHRGLHEECGLHVGRWLECGTFLAAPAYSTELVHVLAGRVTSASEQELDEDEDIEVVRLPLSALPEALDDGCSLAAHSLWQAAGSPT
jgi:ADP-ribose pyrophosphatase